MAGSRGPLPQTPGGAAARATESEDCRAHPSSRRAYPQRARAHGRRRDRRADHGHRGAGAGHIYPVQTTTLTGPAINGVVPTGTAEVNQCKLPKQFGTPTVKVQSVNLPDGTNLTVNYSSLTAGQFDNLGSFKLSNQSGSFSTRLNRMAGANDQIQLTQGPVAILSNPGRCTASYNC